MNNWNDRLLSPRTADMPLFGQIKALLEQQRSTWELFRNGEAARSAILTKRLFLDTHEVIVQANPGRVISTNAKVDAASIAQRPCFLCPASLPPEERGIAFDNYIILPNPYPILEHHVTIACTTHTPQQINRRINDYLALVRAAGPEMFIIYNGPRCGASAPDHLHFQACTSKGVPLFTQIPAATNDRSIVPMNIWGRNFLACSFREATDAMTFVQKIIASLAGITGNNEEPMLNIVARYVNGRYTIAIFPRAKHRSDCYFAPPAERLSISPAAVEMAGIIVVADVTHFDRVNEAAVHAMYKEVTLENDLFARLAEAVT